MYWTPIGVKRILESNILHRAACASYNGGAPILLQIQDILHCDISNIANILRHSSATHLEKNIKQLYEDLASVVMMVGGPDETEVILEHLIDGNILQILPSSC